MKTIIALLSTLVVLFANDTLVIGTPLSKKQLEQHQHLFLPVKEAFRTIGKEVLFKPLPGKRSLLEANEGYIDGDMPRIKTIVESYPNLIVVPVSVGTTGNYIYSIKHSFPIEGIESLAPYSFAILRGQYLLEKETKGMNVQVIDRVEQLFALIQIGRVDLIIIPTLDPDTPLSESRIPELYYLEPPLHKNELYLVLNKKHQNLIDDLEKALIETYNKTE